MPRNVTHESIDCPRCGCLHCPVTKTTKHVIHYRGKEMQIIKRYRRCRHCSSSFSTIEKREHIPDIELPDIEV